MGSKEHLENIKQYDMFIPELIFQEPVENIPRRKCNSTPLRQSAGEKIELDDKQMNKELVKKC